MSRFYVKKYRYLSTAKEVVKCSDWNHQAWKALPTLFLQKLCKDIRYKQLTVASVNKIYHVTFQMKTLQQYSFFRSFLNFWPQKWCKWGINKNSVYWELSLNIDGFLKLRANGQTIVGQQLPTLLDVASICTRCCMLPVVGSCCAKFETGQTFRPIQTDTTL